MWKHFFICFVCLMRYKRKHVTWQWRVLRKLFCLFLTLKGKYYWWIIFKAPSSYFFRFFGIFSNFDMRLYDFLLLWWRNIFFIRQVQEIKPTGKMNVVLKSKRPNFPSASVFMFFGLLWMKLYINTIVQNINQVLFFSSYFFYQIHTCFLRPYIPLKM